MGAALLPDPTERRSWRFLGHAAFQGGLVPWMPAVHQPDETVLTSSKSCRDLIVQAPTGMHLSTFLHEVRVLSL